MKFKFENHTSFPSLIVCLKLGHSKVLMAGKHTYLRMLSLASIVFLYVISPVGSVKIIPPMHCLPYFFLLNSSSRSPKSRYYSASVAFIFSFIGYALPVYYYITALKVISAD